MIQINYHLKGIYVQSVKCNEIADQSGLQVGDQIIQVNGVNVSQMDFSDAISKLKSLPSMTLTVRKGAGKHLFGISKNARNQFNDNKNIKNGENWLVLRFSECLCALNCNKY